MSPLGKPVLDYGLPLGLLRYTVTLLSRAETDAPLTKADSHVYRFKTPYAYVISGFYLRSHRVRASCSHLHCDEKT